MSNCSSRLLRASTLLTVLLACGPLFAADTATPLMGDGAAAISGSDLVTETSTLDAPTRKAALSSPKNVEHLATEMYVRRVLATQAQEQKLDQDPAVQHLLQVVRERVLADALAKRAEARSRPSDPVLENLAQQNYTTQQQRFQQPERVDVRHILILGSTPEARAEAEKVRALAMAPGADFAALAKQYSKDPGSAEKGGELGAMPRGRMIKPFEDAAFALTKPGQISDVIETKFGFHVIQLESKLPAGVQPFAEVKDQLMKEAAAGIAASARQELVRPILDAAKPHTEAIEAFTASQH